MQIAKIMIALVLAWLFAGTAYALTSEDAMLLASGDNDQRIARIAKVVATGDISAAPFLKSLLDDSVKVAGNKVLIVGSNGATDAATGIRVELPDDAQDVINNNRMRSELVSAIAALNLQSPDDAVRLQAAQALRQSDAGDSTLALVIHAEKAEQNKKIKKVLGEIRAGIELGGPDQATRLKAAQELGGSTNAEMRQLLVIRLQPGGRLTRR